MSLVLGHRGSTMPNQTLKDLYQEIAELENAIAKSPPMPALPRQSDRQEPERVEVNLTSKASSAECGSTDIIKEMHLFPIDISYVKRLAYLRPLALNLPDKAGRTAMHAVCLKVREFVGQQDLILWFLRRLGNMHMCDNEGRTALELLDEVEPDSQNRTNVHLSLQRYIRSDFSLALQHPALDVYGFCQNGLDTDSMRGLILNNDQVLARNPALRQCSSHDQSRSLVSSHGSLHVVSCAAPTPSVYCWSSHREIILREVATGSIVKTITGVTLAHTFIVAPFPPKRSEWKRFPNTDLGTARDDMCEILWTSEGDVNLLCVTRTADDVMMTHTENLVEGVPLLKFERSVMHRRGSRLAACILAGPTSTFAMVQKDEAGLSLVVLHMRLTINKSEGSIGRNNESMVDFVTKAIRGLRSDTWCAANLSKSVFRLPSDFKPISLAYAGAGNFPLVASSGDLIVYNCETSSFVTASVSRSSEKDLVESLCGFATNTLLDRFDFVDPLRPLSVMCITRERSVEICRLSVSDRSRRKQVETVRFIMRIPNQRTGGSFTACVHPTLSQFLIIRAATVTTECAAIDVENNVIRLICAVDKVTKLGEDDLFHIIPMVSADGTMFYRRNVDYDMCVCHEWSKMMTRCDEMGPVTWPYAATASMLPSRIPDYRLVETPPEGQVAMVFTDLQGSTHLWSRVGEMYSCVEQHFKIMRRLMIRFRGYECKTEGDAFMVSFQNPLDAFNWCLAVQLVHLVVEWDPNLLAISVCKPVPNVVQEMDDDTLFYYRDIANQVLSEDTDDIVVTEDVLRWLWRGFRVRMGIHVCRPMNHLDPVSKRMDYMGPTINLSARIASSAYGGEIVMSEAAKDYIGIESGTRNGRHGRAICPVTMEEVGFFSLKGIDQEQKIYNFLPSCLDERLEQFSTWRQQEQEGVVLPSAPASPKSPRLSPRPNARISPFSSPRNFVPESPKSSLLLRKEVTFDQSSPIKPTSAVPLTVHPQVPAAPIIRSLESPRYVTFLNAKSNRPVNDQRLAAFSSTSGSPEKEQSANPTKSRPSIIQTNNSASRSPRPSPRPSTLSEGAGLYEEECSKCKFRFPEKSSIASGLVARFCQMCGARRNILLP